MRSTNSNKQYIIRMRSSLASAAHPGGNQFAETSMALRFQRLFIFRVNQSAPLGGNQSAEISKRPASLRYAEGKRYLLARNTTTSLLARNTTTFLLARNATTFILARNTTSGKPMICGGNAELHGSKRILLLEATTRALSMTHKRSEAVYTREGHNNWSNPS